MLLYLWVVDLITFFLNRKIRKLFCVHIKNSVVLGSVDQSHCHCNIIKPCCDRAFTVCNIHTGILAGIMKCMH